MISLQFGLLVKYMEQLSTIMEHIQSKQTWAQRELLVLNIHVRQIILKK